MPTVAKTYRAKRLLSHLLLVTDEGGGAAAKRRRRVRFLEGDEEEDEEEAEEEEEEAIMDFVPSDGEWDCTIATDADADAVIIAAEEMMMTTTDGEGLAEEAGTWDDVGIELEDEHRAHETGPSSSRSSSSSSPIPPLITPPSSPRRIRTLSVDGDAIEMATICEWPSGLAVDNAITAALELVPSHHDAMADVMARRMSAVGQVEGERLGGGDDF